MPATPPDRIIRIPGVLEIRDAAPALRLPLVFDSPHSGLDFPDGSGHVAPAAALDSAVDRFLEDLFAPAVDHGAALLHALFPRTFVDANRRPDDIDPAMVADAFDRPVNPTDKSRRGLGLIRTLVLPGVPMYPGPLDAAAIAWRIDGFWQPYHDALRALLDARHTAFGAVWHVDCHSMKSVGNAMNEDEGAVRPDIVVSDYLGTTSDPAFTAEVAGQFSRCGYAVRINDPYRGDHLIRAYADPAAGRHSVQVEIRRDLYMDETHYTRGPGYARFAGDVAAIVGALADYVRAAPGR